MTYEKLAERYDKLALDYSEPDFLLVSKRTYYNMLLEGIRRKLFKGNGFFPIYRIGNDLYFCNARIISVNHDDILEFAYVCNNKLEPGYLYYPSNK